MAQSRKTDNSSVTTNNLISELLAAPLGSDWTIDALAERVLSAIAACHSDETQEFAVDAVTAGRQVRRLLRPLLACWATKSAGESGATPDLYKGQLSFRRPGSQGMVLICGEFENTPGVVRVTLRRSALANSPTAMQQHAS